MNIFDDFPYNIMGSICPRLFRRDTSSNKSNPYDAHQTFQFQQNLGSVPMGTKQNFQALVQQPNNTGNNINKQSMHNIDNSKSFQSHSSSKVSKQSKISSQEEDREETDEKEQGEEELTHKTSTKSLIRKRLHQSMAENEAPDEPLENLEKARKIITTLNNPKREILIKACKKSTIYIFDTTNSITIENCSDCFIYCAPCSGKLSITNCKEMRLVFITAKLEIRRSKYCQISLFTATPPRISGCSELCFSNFLRIGYYDLVEQFDNCGLEVWNNKFLEVEDIDQNEDEEHYSQKKLHSFQTQWEKTLEEGRIQSSDPIIPIFWGDVKQNKRKQILIMNQPMREIQLKVLKYIISKNVSLQKAYKGIITIKSFERMKQLFPHHEENKYLCIMAGKELQASGLEAYFETIDGKDVEEMEQLLFPSINKQ